MNQQRDTKTWDEILKQMDRSSPPRRGQCANACQNAALAGHIYCEGCRKANYGYPFAKSAA